MQKRSNKSTVEEERRKGLLNKLKEVFSKSTGSEKKEERPVEKTVEEEKEGSGSGLLKTEVLLSMMEDLEEERSKVIASEKKFRAIFEGSNEGIFAVDIKTRKLVFGNQKISQILGYSLEELIGMNIEKIYYPTDWPSISKKFKGQIKKESTPVREFPVLRKNKKMIYCDINTFLVKVNGKDLVIGVFRDVTKLRKTELAFRSEQLFNQQIIETAGIPIISFDAKGDLIVANREFFKMTGYKREDISTRERWHQLAFPVKEVSEKVKKIHKLNNGKRIQNFVFPIICKDQATVLVVGNIGPTPKGGEIIFMRDLSDIFNLEEQIKLWAANGFVQRLRTPSKKEPPLGYSLIGEIKKRDSTLIEITPFKEIINNGNDNHKNK